jgi:hypothetical protein
LVALADVTPTDPSPGQVFQPGAPCSIAWNPDTTGTWKTLYIELMTGDNLNMVHLTTVATVDGTTSPGTFSYPCPAVTLAAPVYFYQFSSPSSSTKTWTGRFTISDASGHTVPAPNPTQPNGQAIPWGTGALVDPSKAVAAPAGGNTTTTGTSTNSTSASPLSSAGPSAVSNAPSTSPLVASQSGFATQSASGVAAAASASAGNTTTSSGSNSGGALVLGTVSTRAANAGVALAVIAGTFMFLV